MIFQHEWKIRVPWGKLALLRCGHPDGEPVLLVHGRQDSSSVFGRLLNKLPDHYNYVALDMPGNGISDAFPNGPKLMRFHFLAAMEMAIDYLGWNYFIFIGHSMGCEQGLFFNAVHPNMISKMILLDAGPTLMRMQVDDPAEYQRSFFDSYYENYHKENFQRKTYTRQSALQTLKRLRGLNDTQCEELLERNFHEYDDNKNLHPIEDWHPSEFLNWNEALTPDEERDLNEARNVNEPRNSKEAPSTSQLLKCYTRENLGGACRPNEARNPNKTQKPEPKPELRQTIHQCVRDPVGYLSWDYRLKHLAPQNYGNDYYFELFKTIPPTLLIAASEGDKNVPPNQKWRDGAKDLLDRLATLDNFFRVNVEGSHDVHFTHPERVAPHILKFLDKKYKKVFSKL